MLTVRRILGRRGIRGKQICFCVIRVFEGLRKHPKEGEETETKKARGLCINAILTRVEEEVVVLWGPTSSKRHGFCLFLLRFKFAFYIYNIQKI